MKSSSEATRRQFLETLAAAPSVALLKEEEAQQPQARPSKFNPIDLSPYFNTAPQEPVPHFGDPARLGLSRIPSGSRTFRGIPFRLGPGGEKKSWLVLREQTVEIPLANQQAGFLCLAQFCDSRGPGGSKPDEVDKLGGKLAEAVLVFVDGTEEVFPIRRRFEVSSPRVEWGQLSFAARSHGQDAPSSLDKPLARGTDWGLLQTDVVDGNYFWDGGTLWLWALPNPHPDLALKALRLRGAGGPLAVCGLTLFDGHAHPFRYERLSLYRITLPDGGAEDKDRWQISTDLGVLGRSYALPEFQAESWLSAPDAGWGQREEPAKGAKHLYVELAATPDATLSLRDTRTSRVYEFDLSRIVAGQELAAAGAAARIEVLEPRKVWLQGKVNDPATGRPTAVRLAFRSPEGRYIPPYGHRTQINAGWFQDYGGDVKVIDSSFAYVDGTFQVELPTGEVFVELSKGFEYGVVRRRLNIEPGQRALNLEISRFMDLRAQGWMTADTHVHFLSPSTAVLEGQAEGLNLINLLAAQWGDLFTNVADLAHGPLTSRDGETTVWVGTENRQHLLGHLGLLGVHGEPVYPMSASGPSESYLGDPVWASMADWADACRKREGVVVAVHFPYPTAEIAADMVLGKIDAVEIYPWGDSFNTLALRDWYQYLNCGYRVPCCGGTDKMVASTPVGSNRTYAYIGKEPATFENWAKAVHSGNTFATTGPLLMMQVDGKVPGEEIDIGANGGAVQVQVEARGSVPFHRVEVVQNGLIVASRESRTGIREMKLDEMIRISGPAWIAARCVSNYGAAREGFGIQAHTSPVYVRVPAQELFSGPAASYMLTLVEGARTWLDTLATRPDKERFEKAHQVLEQARLHLHERLHKHGVPV